MAKKIRSEKEFMKWFEKNFQKLGYEKIIKKDDGEFPDYIMLKKEKKVKVELETLLSNFILHKHDIKKVDEIVCIQKNIKIDKKVIEVKELDFIPRVRRISATVDDAIIKKIKELLKKRKYRNKSHVIEEAIYQLK